MQITVNGKTHSLPNPPTVAGLVAALKLDTRRLAVELNREIVPRSLYDTQHLTEGDTIEIVHFIGGG